MSSPNNGLRQEWKCERVITQQRNIILEWKSRQKRSSVMESVWKSTDTHEEIWGLNWLGTHLTHINVTCFAHGSATRPTFLPKNGHTISRETWLLLVNWAPSPKITVFRVCLQGLKDKSSFLCRFSCKKFVLVPAEFAYVVSTKETESTPRYISTITERTEVTHLFDRRANKRGLLLRKTSSNSENGKETDFQRKLV